MIDKNKFNNAVLDVLNFEFSTHTGFGGYFEVQYRYAQGKKDEQLLIGLIREPKKIIDTGGVISPVYSVIVDIIDNNDNIFETYKIEVDSIPELVKEFERLNLWQNHHKFTNNIRLAFLKYIFNFANGFVSYEKQNLTGGFVDMNNLPNEYPLNEDFLEGFESFKRIFTRLPLTNQQLILTLIITNFKSLIIKNGQGVFPNIIKNVYALGGTGTGKTACANIVGSLFKKVDGSNLSNSHGCHFNSIVPVRRAINNQCGFLLVDNCERVINKNPDEAEFILKNINEDSITITNTSNINNTQINLLSAPYFTSNEKLKVFDKPEIANRTYEFILIREINLGFIITQEMLDSHIHVGDAIAHTLRSDILNWENMSAIDDADVLLDHIWSCLEQHYHIDCKVFKEVKINDDIQINKGIRERQWQNLIKYCIRNQDWTELPFIIRTKRGDYALAKTDFFRWIRTSFPEYEYISRKEIIKELGLDKFKDGRVRNSNKQHVRCIRGLTEEDLINLFSIE